MESHSGEASERRPALGPNASAANSFIHTPNRAESTSSAGRNPFGGGSETPSTPQGPSTNPFASPDGSRPVSSYGSSSGAEHRASTARYFKSRKIDATNVEKPWLKKTHPKEKWITIFPYIGILIGLGISGFLVWDGYSSVVQHNYCSVLDDDFSNGFNTDVWTKEVEVGGFGNGEFVETTGGDENVYVEDGHLHIKATLQDKKKMENNYVMNLLKDGTCTSKSFSACVAATNVTTGNASVVPPTKSGRINTKNGPTIKYGRVEVMARLPKGDWLWPAIWMMPVKDTYGEWPASGEIDIMESRGNDWKYAQGGNNIMSSALHWGPDQANDAWWKTNNKRQIIRGDYSQGWHTFGLEWSEKYLFTYVNSRLLQVMYVDFNKDMWKQGNFPETSANNTRLEDTWTQTGRKNTPFDQKFYLIMNLAVGGTNGWFEDGKSGKPWLDHSDNAKKDFWDARDTWQATWERPEMEIKSVKMWQQCDGGEL